MTEKTLFPKDLSESVDKDKQNLQKHNMMDHLMYTTVQNVGVKKIFLKMFRNTQKHSLDDNGNG